MLFCNKQSILKNIGECVHLYHSLLTKVLRASCRGMAVRAEQNRSLSSLQRHKYFSWPILIRTFCISVSIACINTIEAAEWSIEPSISFGAGHDDNAALTTSPHETVNSVFVTPRVKFGRATEISAVNIGLLVDATNYSGSTFEDTSDQILSLSSFIKTSERTRWGLIGELRRENLFETLLIDPGTGDLRDTDIGLVDAKIKRKWKTVTPSWDHALTERSSLRLSYRFTDVGFSDTTGTGLVEYDERIISAFYSHRISTLVDLNVGLNESKYRPSGSGDKSETRQFLIGATRAFSETSHGRLLAGTSKTTETTAAGDVDTSGFVFEAGIVQRSELATLESVMSRDVHPSGVGQSIESDQIRVYYKKPVTRKLGFVVRANIFREKVLEGSGLGIDRRYNEVEPGLDWHWLPQWFLRTSYRYRRQKFDSEPEEAKSNALFFGAAYAWPKISASR